MNWLHTKGIVAVAYKFCRISDKLRLKHVQRVEVLCNFGIVSFRMSLPILINQA